MEKYLTKKDIADILQVSIRTVTRMMKDKHFPKPIYTGGVNVKRYRLIDVHKFTSTL